MKAITAIGLVAIFILVGLLYLKFKKAMFVLLVPTTVSVMTVKDLCKWFLAVMVASKFISLLLVRIG